MAADSYEFLHLGTKKPSMPPTLALQLHQMNQSCWSQSEKRDDVRCFIVFEEIVNKIKVKDKYSIHLLYLVSLQSV